MSGETLPQQEQISTGSSVLDRQLGSGLRAGSILAIRAPPASQCEGLLYTLMQERVTLFISTLSREAAVRRDLDQVRGHTTEVEVASVADEANMGSEMVKKLTGERSLPSNLTDQGTPLDETFELVRSLDRQANIIINPVTPLERLGDDKLYRTVLNELKSQVMETGGLGVLYCTQHDESPVLRDLTLSLADIVWTLEYATKASEQKYFLTVSKNRARSTPQERIELTINRTLEIDETRNI